jgi:predicted Zn-dependent peptidase
MVVIKKLSNGLPIILEPLDYLKSVSIGVWIKIGSINESVENNGISHMIEHMLFKGTTNRSAKILAEDMAKMGGNLNAYTSKECTSIYATTLEEHLPEIIDLIGDMIGNSCFHKEDIEREKSVIGEEIDMYNDSPEDLVHEMLQKKVWENHPLGYIISGEKNIVNKLTKEEIQGFMNRFYRAENMVISLSGGMQIDKVLDWLETSFGSIKRESKPFLIEKPKYNRCFYYQKKDIEQIYMNIAFNCVEYNSNQKYILSIVNAILGDSENSRMFQVIREELGLTYSIYSYGSIYDNGGLFHIDAILNPKKILQVFSEIFKIIDQLISRGISEKDLLCAKEQIKTEIMISNESTKYRMNSNGRSYLSRQRVVSIEETISCLEQVSMQNVKTFMRQYLNPKESSISLVGNITQVDMKSLKKIWQNL